MGSMKLFIRCFVISLVFLSLNFDGYEATEFLVGGKDNSWHIPASVDSFNSWAEKERFKIGDSLVFKYDSKTDSVLRVEEGDYKKCIKSKPIMEYKDGNTVFPISESGSFFFISGTDGHCEKGEKIEVRVLSHKHSTPPPAQSPNGSKPGVPRPVLSPVESPESSGSLGSSIRVIDAFFVGVVATLVGVAMV